MQLLVAEDDKTTALLLERMLAKTGHDVTVVPDGAEAERAIAEKRFDILLTDWMMPAVNGIELIKRVRQRNLVPLMIMVTQLDSPQARQQALASGADAFVSKPISPELLFSTIDDCVQRHQQPTPAGTRVFPAPRNSSPQPPFVAVVIAASTGGPDSLTQFFQELPAQDDAAFFVVLHGQPWLLELFAKDLQSSTDMTVRLAEDGLAAEPRHVYIASGDRHLCIRPDLKLELSCAARENFCRPSADPLFRSAAEVFGRYCLAIVLTGMGKDGCLGAEHVAHANGTVLVQDPQTALAASMPATIIKRGISHEVSPLDQISTSAAAHVKRLATKLHVATMG